MTQAQMITALADKVNLPKKDTKEILATLADLAHKETKKNGEFILPGLGKLVKQRRKARTGRNPATGEAIKIPAKTVLKFRIAKAAKDAVLGATVAKKTARKR
jgi:DNA-binding protein HU-beta